MNRREFLLVLGIAGCGPQTLVPKPVRRTPRDAGEGSSVAIVDDWAAHYQLSPSPLVLHGKLVARRTSTALELIDAATLHVVAKIDGAYTAVCPADHDALYAFKTAPCAIERFDQTTSDGLLPIPHCSSSGSTTLVAGSSLYLATSDGFAVYHVDKTGVTEIGKLGFAASGDTEWFGLADGRMMIKRGRSVKVYRAATLIDELKTTQALAHLAPGASNRIWYSTWAPDEKNYLDRVVLAKAENGLPAIATFSAARVTHLASGADGGVAILAADETTWFIVVLDRDGVETRRILIPASVYSAAESSVDITSCFVALTATTVLLDIHTQLLGWNLATGTRI